MKKKGGGQKKAAGVSAKADCSAGTPKKTKKTTTSAKQKKAKQKKNNPPELSDIDETSRDRRMLFEMSALKSRAGMSAESESGAPAAACPHFDDQPLDHTSPHKYPPASFVAAAACAASPSNTLEDNDDDEEEEGVSLKGTFKVLVGGDTSALDDLSYSSAEDDEDYDDNLEMTARRIEYSNSNRVRHGQRQTNFIPGGPKSPKYDGMNEVEKAMAKHEYKRERKKITDGLRFKRLREQNKNLEGFSGCLTLGLRTMVDVQKCRLEVNHNFPDKEILVLHVAEEANLRGIIFVCTRSDLREFRCTGPRFCVIARHSEHLGWFVSVANICECDEFGGEHGG
jgi:hypothetical protein